MNRIRKCFRDGGFKWMMLASFLTAAGCSRNEAPETASSGELLSGTISVVTGKGEEPEEKVYRSFRYHIVGPANHRLSIWAECWRDGKLDALSPLTRGRWQLPARGKGLDGYFEYKLVDGKTLGAKGAGAVRWEWDEDWQVDRVKGGDWVNDPFTGLATSSTWDAKKRWTPTVGRTCTLLVLRGDKENVLSPDSTDEELARRSKACLLLRARFEAAKPAEQLDSLRLGGLDVQSVFMKKD